MILNKYVFNGPLYNIFGTQGKVMFAIIKYYVCYQGIT